MFWLVFGILGLQLFGGKYRPPFLTEQARTNFDNFGDGLLTIFQVLTGENWNEVLYTGTGSLGSPLAAALYYIVAFTIFNYVLLNLFIAILLSNITSLPMEEESERRQSVGQAQFVHWFVYRRTVLWARRALQPDEMRPRSRSTRLKSAAAAFVIRTSVRMEDSARRSTAEKLRRSLAAEASAPAAASEWSVEQVGWWLDDTGAGRWRGHFQRHAVDGSALLSLDDVDVQEIGVAQLGARKAIVRRLKSLRRDDG